MSAALGSACPFSKGCTLASLLLKFNSSSKSYPLCGRDVRATGCVWRSKDNLWESILFLLPLSESSGLGSNPLYLLSRLAQLPKLLTAGCLAVFEVFPLGT